MWRKIVQNTYRRYSRLRVLEALANNREMRFAQFLGTLANMWASIERDLDDWVTLVHHAGGAEKIQTFLPTNLDRELDYLKAALKCGLVPVTTRDEARRIVRELHALKNFRHTLIHGVLIEIDESDRVVVDFWRVLGAARTRIRTPYTKAQLSRHLRRTRTLQLDIKAFVDTEYTA